METFEIKTTFLIVGGGIAGVSCAENVSFMCPGEKILLITESYLIKAVTNLRCLGKMVQSFEVEEKEVKDSKLNENVDVLEDSVIQVCSEEKMVLTKSGKKIFYSFLCLCTGAQPKLIQQGNPFIFGIRDTESVLDFQEKVKSSRRLVIVGNGGIASEIVYELGNIEVHWVVKDSFISSTFADPGAAEFFQKKLEESEKPGKPILKRMRYKGESMTSGSLKGAALGPDWHRKIDISGGKSKHSLEIHYKTEVSNIKSTENEEYPLEITLSNNKVIPCDFLVSATGVDPRISHIPTDVSFELGKDGGIKVNEMMESSVENIFAAGDVCCAGWDLAENWFQMRLWTQARQMGAMAGRSMAAKFKNEPIYQDFCFELFTHATHLFGYQVVLLGNFNGQGLGQDYEILLRYTPDLEYIKFVMKDGRLKGVILIGETGLEETCENLILNGLDLTPFGDDILNPDVDIEDFFD
ncbi:PYROXD1 family protein [Megaselia abdita]